MDAEIAAVGMVLAAVGLIASVYASIARGVSLKQITRGDGKTKVIVDGKTYEFDLESLEKEDPRKLDRAIQRAKGIKNKELAA